MKLIYATRISGDGSEDKVIINLDHVAYIETDPNDGERTLLTLARPTTQTDWFCLEVSMEQFKDRCIRYEDD